MSGPSAAMRRSAKRATRYHVILEVSARRRSLAALTAIRSIARTRDQLNLLRLCACAAICANRHMLPTQSHRSHPAQCFWSQRPDRRIARASVSNILPSLASLASDQCALSATPIRNLGSCPRVWTRAFKHGITIHGSELVFPCRSVAPLSGSQG
jgi:hypothetical protein